jgi:hypothetical protein
MAVLLVAMAAVGAYHGVKSKLIAQRFLVVSGLETPCNGATFTDDDQGKAGVRNLNSYLTITNFSV